MKGKWKEKFPLLREEGDRTALLEKVCLHLLFGGLGALLGGAELLFGVRPFGVALAAAADVYLPAVLAGAALRCLLARDHLTLTALGICVGLRLFAAFLLENERPRTAREVFSGRPLFRVAAAGVAMFTTGLYTVIRGGYRYYDLFGVLLAVSAAPLCAWLFTGLFEKKDKLFSHSREAGLAALTFTAIFALRTFSFVGIFPAAAAAAGVAFLLTAHRDLLWGAVGGALAGLAFEPRMAPAFLFCAVAFGLLEKSSRGGGILAGSAAAAGWGFLLDGTAGLAKLLPALLTAGALFLATDSAGLIEGTPNHRAGLARRRAGVLSAKAGELAAGEAQLKEISGAFLDLSGTFYELSSRQRRPGLLDLRHLCDKTFDGVCPRCKNREICWGSEYAETAATLGALAQRLHSRGAVSAAQIPPALAERCREMPGLLAAVNNGAARLTEEALRGDKTAVVAMDYAAMGRLLNETLQQNREAYVCDGAAGERIAGRLSRMGYQLESVAVCGKKHRSVILRGVRMPGQHLKMRELRRVLETYCHFALGDPTVTAGDGMADIVFPERTQLESATVKLTRSKGRGEERYCGDAVVSINTARGYDYMFVCDGMGSGNGAALTSALAADFLTRMLQAGSGAENALKMLNGFLAARGRRESESSTTVDLLEVDRISGEGVLFKCGAAPSYLLRGGTVTRFFSRTAPAGILETLDAERIRFQVEPGDVLVQVSDGVTGGEEDCPWLREMLADKWDGNAEAFARMALGRAAKESKDDLSILITEMRAAQYTDKSAKESA